MMTRRVIRVLVVFLNTGGGHRSAADATAEALRDLYGDRVRVDVVDVTREYFSWPVSKLDEMYEWLIRMRAWPWAIVYHLTDGARRFGLVGRGVGWLTGRSIGHLLAEHPAELVVCCHPLLRAPLARGLRRAGKGRGLITLVTDLASGHAAWFVPPGERWVVATEGTRGRAAAMGIPTECIEVSGLPVRRCFVNGARRDPVAARRRLGLDPDSPVVLLMGGAMGTGPLLQLVRAMANSGLWAELVVITGRNKSVYEKLSSYQWSLPVHVAGFVSNLHEWMEAADILVTKAGPGTLSEALVMGLPMVLCGALPGQERPNVDYVVANGAGVWAPTPAEAAERVQELLERDRSSLMRMEERARILAQPDAARRAARVIWGAAEECSLDGSSVI